MDKILSTIHSPKDLQELSPKELEHLARDIREALCRLLGQRTAHFASNLGVVELAIALHTTFDFSRDRLIWDTGHQVYPHKMITGRYDEFNTIRTRGGLMGYPNPAESEYDLFMTGHAGCSVSCGLGLTCADDLVRPDENRHSVVVIGDGAFSSGIVLEAMNHAGGLKKNLTVVLNDNKMSICPRVGGIADCLDRLRMSHLYTGLKTEIQRLLNNMPMIGDPVERFLTQTKDAIKAGILGGMLFEELGFRYIGPVDGHDIRHLQKYLAKARAFNEPVLLHVVTEKGRGFAPAEEDPVTFHTPAPFARENGAVVSLKKQSAGAPYTELARDAIQDAMRRDGRVCVITAAMCQGNMLEPVREEFPDRFFDVGICESHAVAFAAGLAKAGMRPIVDIYSTFLQRSYDQIFQELSLQKLPVVLMLDRAGVVGPDGPTHHGVFDLAYLRPFPDLTIMAPADSSEMAPMLELALSLDHPSAIRYPKCVAESVNRVPVPVELGTAEIVEPGEDGLILVCGTLLGDCGRAVDLLRSEGLNVGLINARFVKPLDTETLVHAIRQAPFTLTVEEGTLAGGFGSAVLEALCDAGVEITRFHRLGIPDRYIELATRSEQLDELGLTTEGIATECRRLALAGETAAAPVRHTAR
ncbi:MAG: 1-deoxy-D-xylulose-5-phosphate synthase [Thermoguttaceae bacterium]